MEDMDVRRGLAEELLAARSVRAQVADVDFIQGAERYAGACRYAMGGEICLPSSEFVQLYDESREPVGLVAWLDFEEAVGVDALVALVSEPEPVVRIGRFGRRQRMALKRLASNATNASLPKGNHQTHLDRIPQYDTVYCSTFAVGL